MAVVCVTGASGFFASWLIKRLLEAGYSVRGTVRSPGKASHLWQIEGAKERLELFRADFTTEGVFDSIVEGCEGVFHTATPTLLTADDPEREIIQAAVFGTLNVLKSCKRSSTVKRVIVTSSTATLRFAPGVTSDTVIDESYWSSEDLLRRKQMWYNLSKTLAEKSAWEFAAANGIDLVTVIPSFVYGSFLTPQPATSAGILLSLLNGDASEFAKLKYVNVVHQDDVASAHILAYEKPEAHGRYLCTGVDISNNDLAEFLSRRYPEYQIATSFGPVRRGYKRYNANKLRSLGLNFKGLEQMFDDCIASLKQQGLLQARPRSRL